jgi:hypothetical protein
MLFILIFVLKLIKRFFQGLERVKSGSLKTSFTIRYILFYMRKLNLRKVENINESAGVYW